MILFAALAAAEVAAPCAEPYFAQSSPADGADGVPVDVRPALFFAGRCAVGVLTLHLDRLDAEEPRRVLTADVQILLEQMVVVEVDLGDPLAPNAAYELTLLEGLSADQTLSFRTSDGLARPALGAPEVEVVDALRYPGIDARFEGTFEITPIADGSLFVASIDGTPRHAVRGPGRLPFETQFSWEQLGDGRRFCVSVQERDLAGGWSEPSAEVCERATGTGCQHAPVGLFAGLLAIPLVRRRRCAR